jgi:hypothetical protein
MKRGRCELCHEIADLHDSHYLPKGGYKRLRASGLKNPNPVVLSGGVARQNSLQVRDYKFCSKCEKRFNDGGEAWILNNNPCNYGEPFWLQTLLTSKTPTIRGETLLFAQAVIPEVDMAQLVYFALSIFWRGTRRWSAVQGGQPPELNLGGREEAIRLFLLGRSKLPEDVVITVAVWPYKTVYPMALTPRADSATSYRSYWFYFFGFIFQLALGDEIPDQQREACSYHSCDKFQAACRLSNRILSVIAPWI